MLFLLQISATDSTSLIVPISLFTYIIDTSAVFSLIAEVISSTLISPSGVTPTNEASYPLSTFFFTPNKDVVGSLFEYNSPFKYLHVFNVALCSTRDVIT